MPQQGRDAHQAAGWHELPPELLAKLLGRLVQRDRLGGAALVCRAWAAPATAATEHVQLAAVQDGMHVSALRQRMQALWAWLQQHGGHVASLVEQGEEFEPCPYLRWDIEGERDSGNKAAAWPLAPPPPALPRLAALRLLRCPLPWPAAALSALSALTELHVEQRAPAGAGERLSAVLPQLSGLRRLGLTADLHDDGLAAAIAGLAQLQALRLDGAACKDVCALPLPAGMTQLELRPGWRSPLALSSQATPHLAALTALRDLRLRDVQLEEPGMWGSSLVSLTRFELHGDGGLPGGDGAARATAELLRLLGQQTALAHLAVTDALQQELLAADEFDMDAIDLTDYDKIIAMALGGGSALYAHLVRSSLTHLAICGPYSERTGCSLPFDAGRIMFGQPGLSLPGLVHLDLSAEMSKDGTCLSAADVACIAACTGGALRELRLVNVVHRGADGIDWGVFTSLTKLTIGGFKLPCTGLAQLTGLRSLSVEIAASFTDDDLCDVALHLTRLSFLSMCDYHLSRAVSDDLGDMHDRSDADCDWFDIQVRSGAVTWGGQGGSVSEEVQAGLQRVGVWHKLLPRAQQRAALRAAAAAAGGGAMHV